MAVSEVSICNLALQKLGAARIVSLSDNSRNARSVNACYAFMRDRELAANKWNFAKTRATLAPSSVTPAFNYDYAFVLPSDCLTLVKPARLGLDWQVESHQGEVAILTSDGNTLQIRYIARITDPTKFHPLFSEMLACKIAWHCCEDITQSNTKKAAVMQEYTEVRAEARKANAFMLPHNPEPVDEWLAARITGQLVNTEWNEE